MRGSARMKRGLSPPVRRKLGAILWRSSRSGDKPPSYTSREGGMRSMILAALLATAIPGSALAKPANVTASVAATSARSEDNVKLDASRKPAEVLKFLGLQEGMWVADPFGANLYWAE